MTETANGKIQDDEASVKKIVNAVDPHDYSISLYVCVLGRISP